MIKFEKLFLGLLIVTFSLTSCESLLDDESDRRVFSENNHVNTQNDIIYAMSGIFSQLEKLSSRYVLLGELRGDLMDITKNSNKYLEEIYNFNISDENPYNKISDYYSVINNCNYFIQSIDTSIIIGGEKIMYKTIASIKAIRAWTYLQIALNYGNVKYYELPILTLKDTNNYILYSLNELIPVLINDLEPWKNQENPIVFSLGSDLSSERLYFPVRFVLGDLYLWNGNYEQAAIEYYSLIEKNKYVIDEYSKSTWTVVNNVFVEREFRNQLWFNRFILSSDEFITLIAASTEYGKNAELDSLCKYYEIVPSSTAINNWNKQLYYYNDKVFTEGDLRGDLGSYLGPAGYSIIVGNLNSKVFVKNQILKFSLMSGTTTDAISIYRIGLLYLRYAEAINRTGRPNLAFAALKYGLNSKTIRTDTIVPKKEKYVSYSDTTGILYNYVNFENVIFNYNIGIHSLGCGNIHLSNDYKIPQLGSLNDSIIFVEDKILEELALETAFEGNRFHDLMRIALRRDDPAFLANKVSDKYSNNKEFFRSKLMNVKNWYLSPKY
jgi:hypothetical protein